MNKIIFVKIMQQQPLINAPRPLIILIGILIIIHAIFWLLPPYEQLLILNYGAFMSAKIVHAPSSPYYSFVTYGFLHGDWTHLIFNTIWLLIFGKVCFEFYGTYKAFTLFILGTIAGSLTYHIIHYAQDYVLIGASAGVSAMMAAALRVILSDKKSYNSRYTVVSLLDSRFLGATFIWAVVNFLSASGALSFIPGGQSIAWESHMGGYIMGMFFPEMIQLFYKIKGNKKNV
jgi:membrane associated rhomboid family serine protease